MRLSGQFQASFFFYEKILSMKKALKCKINDFHPPRSFCARKKCCLCCLVFVLLVLLVSVFFTLKNFFEKKKNCIEIVNCKL